MCVLSRSLWQGCRLAVKAGTLDDVTDLVPTKHYWMRSKQAWVAIPDNVALSEMD